jgi:SHS2 domain-containing protein
MPSAPSPPEAPRWELYAHGADVGIRGSGATLAAAFEGIGLALTAAVTELAEVVPRQAVGIHCAAPDADGLLYEWVNALVYEMATRRMLFSRYRVSIAGTQLDAEVWGEALDAPRHQPAVEVKGATYTDLRVANDGGRWTAQCIIDV